VIADFNLYSSPSKLTVGLVGYPNVGKSSTINALVGAKKVSVSSTPGKTKNFQTIHLSESMVLCDCPGLVFPQFAATNADMICDGVLPIDQMREYTAPVDIVTRRIPQEVLEATYGLRIHRVPIEEGGVAITTASELLSTYAGALSSHVFILANSQLIAVSPRPSRSGFHHPGTR
jgi:large subunit GTPase 1